MIQALEVFRPNGANEDSPGRRPGVPATEQSSPCPINPGRCPGLSYVAPLALKKPPMKTNFSLLTLPLGLLLASPAFAATKTWDGGQATVNWGDAANWNADGVPTSADAVVLDNSTVNPLPVLNALAGGNCGTLTIDGAMSGHFLNSPTVSPRVLNLYGASVNTANTGPLIWVGPNAPVAVSTNKIEYRLQTSGELRVEAGKSIRFMNCLITENGIRSLTKTGAGTVWFSNSGPEVHFTGGLNLAEGVWDAGARPLDLPAKGLVTFTNAEGVTATLTSGNSHSIEGLAGGNSSSNVYVTGATGLTLTGAANTTFGGHLLGATRLTLAGSGSLTLTGDNPFTGTTVIQSGKLALGVNGVINRTPSIQVDADAVFDVTSLAEGFTLLQGQTLHGSGRIDGKLTAASGASISPGSTGLGNLTISNGLTLQTGSNLALELTGTSSYDSLTVTNGDVVLAGNFTGTLGYTPEIGDTLYLIRNTGTGATSGTLGGSNDGDKIDIGGKWFRLSFTSDFGGAGFQTGGSGNDVAIQRIDDPTPSGLTVAPVGSPDTALVRLRFSWVDNTSNETGFRVYQVREDGSLVLLETLPAGATAFEETVPNYATYSYAIEAFEASGTLGDLRTIAFSAGSTLEQRREAALNTLSTQIPNLDQFGAGPNRVGRTGFWFGEARLMRDDPDTGLSYITTALEDASAEGSNSGFSLWPGMDAWHRWGSLFPQSLKDRYREVYTGSTLYGLGFTPNQQFMASTARYLAGEWWPDDSFASGAAYGTGDPTGKTFLTNVIERTPWWGFEESNSNTYLPATLGPMETLARFAPDPALRHKAGMAVDWAMAEAAGYWLNGHWGVSASRYGTPGVQNSPTSAASLWWLLFGGPTPASPSTHMPFLSKEFPGILPELETAGRDRRESYTRRTFALHWVYTFDAGYFKQSWMTPGYCLWSQVEGNVTVNPDRGINLLSLDAPGVQDGYQGQRWGLAWDAPPGDDAILKITTPTTYKTGASGISIYEDTLQHQDTAVAVYNIPATSNVNVNNGAGANQWLTGHIPSGWLAITDESATTGRIFLHYKSVLVAVYLSAPFSWTSPDFTVSPWVKGAVVMETAPLDEFTQATAEERLAAFRAAVLAHTPDVSAINDTKPRFVYTNRHGDVLDLTYGMAGKINNVTVDYQSWPMIEDPWVYQSQQGHLHVKGPDRTVISNYHDWSRSENHRPSVSSNPSVVVSKNTPVDIDLTARVEDAETPGAQLAFSVNNPANGSVVLLEDGKTARFTPAKNATGPASFELHARDRGLHPRVVWHYDFEEPATLTGNTVRDASGTERDATVSLIGTGTAALEATTPTALGANSTRSIRLNESGTNAARLSRLVTRSNLEMSNGSWTFATWFKRASRTSDDFLFYVGSGDGFGGHGDELQVRLNANAARVNLEHYNTANVMDVSLVSPATALTGIWNHVTVTFEKTADNTGTLRLYLNGVLAATAANVTWALQQQSPVIIGGHAIGSGAEVSRYFNGWIDDTVLLRGALSASEIASLAKQSVATFSGTEVSARVPVNVLSHQQNWRLTYFDTTEGTGDAADSVDSDQDGETNLYEFATGQNPRAATRIAPVSSQTGSVFQFDYKRGVKAMNDGVSFIPEWSDTLLPGSWNTSGITQQILSDDGTIQSMRASIERGNETKRFWHLKVVSP